MAKKRARKAANDQPALAPLAERVAQLRDGLAQMESVISEAVQLTASESERVEELRRGVEAALAAAELRANEKEELLQQRDSVLKESEATLMAQVRALKERIQEQEESLKARDAELAELKAKAQAMAASPEPADKQEQETRPLRRLHHEGAVIKKSPLGSLLAPIKRKS